MRHGGFGDECVAAGRHVELRGLLRAGAVMLGIVVLGLALAAIQIIPLFELVRSNFREGSVSYTDVAGWALPVASGSHLFHSRFFWQSDAPCLFRFV